MNITFLRSAAMFMATLVLIALLIPGCKKDGASTTHKTTSGMADTIHVTGPLFVYDTVGFSSTAPSGDTYVWSFGDGTMSTLASPTHIYSVTGHFTVTLTDNGDTAGTSTLNITYGAERFAHTWTWTGGYYLPSPPQTLGDTARVLPDTTFAIAYIDDSTLGLWGANTNAYAIAGAFGFTNQHNWTGTFGPNLRITADTIFFTKGVNQPSYTSTTSYYRLR